MYNKIKQIVKKVVPKKFLLKNELFLRKLYSYNLTGGEFYCPICDSSLKKFINLENKDLLCPVCGSRSRTRRLYKILEENDLLQGKILHFSPSRSLYRILKKINIIDYVATDFENEFLADYRYDITNIACPTSEFNTIICYHILEHIAEDEKAMRELSRVLSPKGICLVQTPFMDGEDIYEDFTISHPKEREKAFGQKDHVRIYSVSGLMERLRQNGFLNIKKEEFPAFEKEGLTPETVLFLRK